MIEAEHKRWAFRLIDIYLNKQFRKYFNRFYLCGDVPHISEHSSFILTPNHFSWWDGFLIYFAWRKYFTQKRFHLMMLERQLQRYWFFRKVGCFSIDTESDRGSLETVRYTRALLSESSNLVVLFPQGKIEPVDIQTPAIKKGLVYFTADIDSPVTILPTAFRIEYGEEKLPDIFCRFGEAVDPAAVKRNFSLFEEAFTDNIEKLRRDTYNGNVTEVIFPPQ